MSAQDLEPVFRKLTPPAGGLAELRGRIEAQRRHRTRRFGRMLATGTALSVATILALVVMPGTPAAHPGDQMLDVWVKRTGDPTLLHLASAPMPEEPVVVRPGSEARLAVQRVDTGTERVIYYRFDSLAPPAAAEAARDGLESVRDAPTEPRSPQTEGPL